MATVSTSTTLFVVYIEDVWNEEQIMLTCLCVFYVITGFGISVYLYGRKTSHDAEDMVADSFR